MNKIKINIKRSNRWGFSLIELMVVISIAAILVALGTVSYTTAQKKGRDAKRRGDMKALSDAFEQYYALNNTYDTNTSCNTMTTDTSVLPAGAPTDPKPSMSYTLSCPNANSYCICAELEEEGKGNSGASCASFGSSGDYFCMVNQQ